MIRSYCLTFAAVTVRLVSIPLLVITGSVTFTVSASIWSWVVNAGVAECGCASEEPSRPDGSYQH